MKQRYEPILLSPTYKELIKMVEKSSPKMRQQFSMALKLVEKCQIVDAEKKVNETHDDVIVRVASEWKCPVATYGGATYSADVSVYPYKGTVSAMGISQDVAMSLWYGWAAIALVVLGGILGIVGSLIIAARGKRILMIGGILALLSIIIFAAGLQNELSKTGSIMAGMPALGLFTSGSFTYMGIPFNYSTYLSYGFFLALIAAVLMLISTFKHPMEAEAAAPPPPQ